MSNLYKLTTKLAEHALQNIGEAKLLLRENQMRTARRMQNTKEQALTNITLNILHNYKLKITWKDVKKACDSVTYTAQCLHEMSRNYSLIKTLLGNWSVEIKVVEEVDKIRNKILILNVRITRLDNLRTAE